MKKEVGKFRVFLISLAFLVFSLSVVSATFSYEGNTLKKSYAGGEEIDGTFNISFFDELAEGILSTNFGQNISLLTFLEDNDFERISDFNCSTVSCGTDYASISPISDISLSSGVKKYVGFRLTGTDVEGISEIGIDVTSNAASSCGKQLDFGLIGESGNLNFINDNYVDEKCGIENYGCFDSVLGSYSTATIGSNVLCEKISLPSGPAFTLGARVKNDTTSSAERTLKMQLYNIEGDLLKEGVLPKHTQNTQKLKTIVNYSNAKGGEYLVCITGSSGNEYKINRETSGENCGTNSFGSDNYNKDYEIFAYPVKSGTVNFKVREGPLSVVSGESILDFVEDYIFEHYSGVCSPECIIPVELLGVSQTVNFGSPKLKYTESGDNLENSQIYSISKKDAKVTSPELELDLSLMNINIPLGTKNNSDFKIYLDGDLIFQEKIDVEESFDFNINPSFALIGIKTVFKAVTSENITKSEWDFGDGGTRTGSGKSVSYAYSDSGTYNAEIKLTNKAGTTSTKVFTIVSGNAREAANLTIDKYEERIANLTSYYKTLSGWIKIELEKSVNPEELSASLKEIKEDYLLAGNDSDYVDIMNNLLEINVPISVSISEEGTLPIESSLLGLNTDYIEEVSLGGTNKGDLEIGIISWMRENYGANVDFEVYEARYDSGSEEILTRFRFDIEKKSDFDDSVYFFVDYPIDRIKFKESYGEKQIGGGSGAYFILNGGRVLEFIIPEKLSVEDLRAYISPEMNNLPVLFDEEDVREKNPDEFDFSFGKFWIGIIVLIIAFFVVYIFLQEWYKRNYESHLFSTKDLLYNLLSFIYNGRASGLTDGQIRKKLNVKGWGGEQITYALKKIDGKRTGMWEIPIFKSSENKKVREEIQKRLPPGRKVDARFIKRPRF